MIFIVGIAMFGIVYSATNGTWPSFYGEMFTTQVRLSGMAVGTQIGFAIAGFVPAILLTAMSDGELAGVDLLLTLTPWKELGRASVIEGDSMQCPNCGRRVARNKNGLIEKHYIEEVPVAGWEQKECPAVGTEDGKGWSSYQANRSTMRCPCCDTVVHKKKDGRMRVHNDGNRECKASVANRG